MVQAKELPNGLDDQRLILHLKDRLDVCALLMQVCRYAYWRLPAALLDVTDFATAGEAESAGSRLR